MAELPSLLLVDDDVNICETLSFSLKDMFNVTVFHSRTAVKSWLYSTVTLPNLALIDLGLPPRSNRPDEGFALVSELLSFNNRMRILILSGQDSHENARHALTLGASDFMGKPIDISLLRARIKHQQLLLEIERAEQQPSIEPQKDYGLVGDSFSMQTLRAQIQQFAESPFAVLVQGDSGVGKELVAQCLHTQSVRRNAPCLTVNCAAFTSELLDAQLFGHSKGAYTGAAAARTGFFEEAGNGSLILDEIGEMPLQLQSKLLRVLENGEYYRIGETKVRRSSARIIAATNRDLREQVKAGRFRGDLYHRLSVLTVKVPCLAERGDDSLLLLAHFQNMYRNLGTDFELDAEAMQCWRTYSFPGNVRELRNIVIRLGAKYPKQVVTKELLERELETTLPLEHTELDSDEAIAQQLNQGDFSLDDTLLDWERRYINSALEISQGNLSQAARLLGINRTTLYSKMQRLSKG
jgi:DNA-binding NtrC family response regulator